MALWKDRLVALSSKKDSFIKVNSKRIGNGSALPILFFILQRSLWEYQGQGRLGPRTIPCPDGLVRRLLLLQGKIDIYKKVREAKNKAGGGDEIKKINRPISLGKEGFPRKKVLKNYFLFWELSTEK